MYCYIGIDLDLSKPKGMPLSLKLHSASASCSFTTKYISVTAAGCRPVIPVLTFVLTGDVHRSGYASGHYGDSVRDGYRILFYLGWAHTNLTKRWQALFSRYS